MFLKISPKIMICCATPYKYGVDFGKVVRRYHDFKTDFQKIFLKYYCILRCRTTAKFCLIEILVVVCLVAKSFISFNAKNIQIR